MKLNPIQISIAFLVGLLIGAGTIWLGGYHRDHGRWHGEKRFNRMVERFSSKLELTPEQKTQVAAILKANHEKMKALREESRPRFEEIRKSTDDEIRKILRPDQQVKFDELQKRWDAKREKRRSRWE